MRSAVRVKVSGSVPVMSTRYRLPLLVTSSVSELSVAIAFGANPRVCADTVVTRFSPVTGSKAVYDSRPSGFAPKTDTRPVQGRAESRTWSHPLVLTGSFGKAAMSDPLPLNGLASR